VRHRIVSLLCLVGCAAGCSHNAYPGESRPASQVAVVVAAFEPATPGFEGSPSQEVRLLRISGSSCPEQECIGATAYAYLLPGAYAFDVDYRSRQESPVVALFGLFSDLVGPDRTERRLSFSVEAAKKYEIYFDPSTSTYSIFVWNQPNPSLDAPERPGFQPPFGVSVCVPPASTVAPPACSSAR